MAMVSFYLPKLMFFTSIFGIFCLGQQKQRRTSGFNTTHVDSRLSACIQYGLILSKNIFLYPDKELRNKIYQ